MAATDENRQHHLAIGLWAGKGSSSQNWFVFRCSVGENAETKAKLIQLRAHMIESFSIAWGCSESITQRAELQEETRSSCNAQNDR